MNIHHIRNATCVIETKNQRILVDPMLSDKGELVPFSFIRFTRMRNPTADLPQSTDKVLAGISHCLITHCQTFGIKALQHTDHLDAKGEAFLTEHNTPVICRKDDADYLKKYKLNVEQALEYWQPQGFAQGRIVAVPAQHGHGWNHHLMANGAGFYIELPEEPSIYISGDTVLTSDVKQALGELKPDIAVAAAGSAQLDIGPPILMNIEEVLEFTKLAPGKVILNHLEALNHCPTTRKDLRKKLQEQGLLQKVFIPADGETISVQ